MPKSFLKTKSCGCVVRAITCGTTNTHNGRMYLIGGHIHLTICDKCKQAEENDDDTLYDMWINDDMTNDLEYAGWIEQK